jgi:uncharacterized membrane protein YhiD involved in acid resistance
MSASLASLQFDLAELGSLLLRLVLAALLGAVVAVLYRLSRPPEERTHGFAHTLVLLAPLIAMVTTAVGGNTAAAFTLVGTLAIVRFRTVVRDTRDTVFVIFSVAIGMAIGVGTLAVTVAGTLVLATVILLLRVWTARRHEPPRAGHLRLTLHPADCPDRIWQPVVDAFATSCRVERSTVDRKREQLELRLLVLGLDPQRGTELVQRLSALPEVAQATYTAEEEGAAGPAP